MNPLYTDTRYNDKIHYIDNLNVTKPSLRRWQLIRIITSSNIWFGYLLESPHWGDSNKYPKHMLYEKIRIKQGISYVSFWPLRILYNSKFISMNKCCRCNEGSLYFKERSAKDFMRSVFNDAYAIFFSDFLHKSMLWAHVWIASTLVEAIQMSAHMILWIIGRGNSNECPQHAFMNNRIKHASCDMNIQILFDCALIGACAVITPNTVLSLYLCFVFLYTHTSWFSKITKESHKSNK